MMLSIEVLLWLRRHGRNTSISRCASEKVVIPCEAFSLVSTTSTALPSTDMTAPVTLADFKLRLRQLAEDAAKLGLHAEEHVLWSLHSYIETEQTKATQEIAELMKAATR